MFWNPISSAFVFPFYPSFNFFTKEPYFQTLTGTAKGDGIIGVMLGLFIAAHPAADFLDMFFFEKDARYRFSLKWSALLWLVLDLLVLLIGWYVIFIGLTRLLGRGGYGWFPA